MVRLHLFAVDIDCIFDSCFRYRSVSKYAQKNQDESRLPQALNRDVRYQSSSMSDEGLTAGVYDELVFCLL